MTLTTYVLAAILAWTHSHSSPKPEEIDRLTAIAQDIAEVALEEEPLFKGDVIRVKTALLLASVARYESGFAPWIDTGLCNDTHWREGEGRRRSLNVGDCDGGHAFSLWQIHAGSLGPLLVSDRRAAVREAIARLRKSLASGRGLCGYTGEVGDCPKAELRLRTAQVWELGHPFWSSSGKEARD